PDPDDPQAPVNTDLDFLHGTNDLWYEATYLHPLTNPPREGVPNRIVAVIVNRGYWTARNFRVNFSVTDYSASNANTMHVGTVEVAVLKAMANGGTSLEASVPWTPTVRNDGGQWWTTVHQCLHAQIDYGFDTDYLNNR